MFPVEATARTWQRLTEVATHVGTRAEAVTALQEKTGTLNDSIRNFALLPDTVLRQAVAAARETVTVADVDEQHPLTPVDAAQIGLMWRIARRLMTPGADGWNTFIDFDPMVATSSQSQPSQPQQAQHAQGGQAQLGGAEERKLKMSSYIDQADDGEFIPASRQQVETWFQNYYTFAAGPPLEPEEPTSEQLQALNTRSNTRNQSPYADLSIWGPFNRKIVRAMKFVAWLPQPDGSWLRKEIPGPGNYQAWVTCWRVFRVACLMLQLIGETALSAYQQCIERLSQQWPEAWHLIALADDKMRMDGFERIRRATDAAVAAGGTTPPLWDTAKPWTAVMLIAAKDKDYWNENVRDIATAWMARGSPGVPLAPDEQLAQSHLGGKQNLSAPKDVRTGQGGQARPWGEGESRGAKQRKRARDSSKGSADSWGGAGKSKGKDKKGKGKGKNTKGKGKHTKDPAGTPICFSWGSKTGQCAGDGPCQFGRVHICQWCLSPAHRTCECS